MASSSYLLLISRSRSRPSSSRLIASCSFTSSSISHTPGDGVNPLREGGRFKASKDDAGNPLGREPGPLYREWLDEEGKMFRNPEPNKTNWLGGSVPFPLNPSFKPPPPLSDALRSHIYSKFMSDPHKNNPRKQSADYGISIKRVEAIIRLKSHEAKWKRDGHPLQTGFLKAFESATGVYQGVKPEEMRRIPESLSRNNGTNLPDRSDAAAADYDADWEQMPTDDIARIYWEPVQDGAEPVVPAKLQEVAQRALDSIRSGANSTLTSTASRTTFVDIEGKFMHTNEREVKRAGRGEEPTKAAENRPLKARRKAIQSGKWKKKADGRNGDTPPDLKFKGPAWAPEFSV